MCDAPCVMQPPSGADSYCTWLRGVSACKLTDPTRPSNTGPKEPPVPNKSRVPTNPLLHHPYLVLAPPSPLSRIPFASPPPPLPPNSTVFQRPPTRRRRQRPFQALGSRRRRKLALVCLGQKGRWRWYGGCLRGVSRSWGEGWWKGGWGEIPRELRFVYVGCRVRNRVRGGDEGREKETASEKQRQHVLRKRRRYANYIQ
jgi:hypothetical protein